MFARKSLGAGIGLLLVAASGCFNQPKIDAGSLKCKSDENCPTGYRCDGFTATVLGVCTRSAGDGAIADGPMGAGGDAGRAADGSSSDGTGTVAIDGETDQVALADGSGDQSRQVSDDGAADTQGAPVDGRLGDSPAAAPEVGPDVPIAGDSGASGSGGAGGATSGGGTKGLGGASGSGGSAISSGGSVASSGGSVLGAGGAVISGGVPGAGGTVSDAAISGGGVPGAGGGAGSDASVSPTIGPCDIYQAANTPCVAAHSTVRALFGAYSGALYQLRRQSDGGTMNVSVSSPGGYVDISVQDSFCTGTSCTISIIYDQSPKKNDLSKAGPLLWMVNGGDEADASKGQIQINGHIAHGIYVDNPGSNVAYRNIQAIGLAKGDEPESMYAVLDGTWYSATCCFDYGNAGTSGKDEGSATMEAIYWGNSTQFQKGGAGKGPWIAADLENGMFECDTPGAICTTNMAITWALVTAVLKGPSGNTMGIKAGNAQSGGLQTMWDGNRPPGYSPMKKTGAIILGTSGDGSNWGRGTFFEGAITSGNPPDSADDAVQANIVAARYGQ